MTKDTFTFTIFFDITLLFTHTSSDSLSHSRFLRFLFHAWQDESGGSVL